MSCPSGSIKETVRATFQQVWFLPPSVSAAQAQARPRKSLADLGSSSSSASLAGANNGATAAADDSVAPAVAADTATASTTAPSGAGRRRAGGGGGAAAAAARHVEATALQLVDVVAETVLGRLAEGSSTVFFFAVPSVCIRCDLTHCLCIGARG
jgi:hypothetical protein